MVEQRREQESQQSSPRSSDGDSVDEAEVERIFRERQLQKQAQEELKAEGRSQVITSAEIEQVVNQADQVQSRVDQEGLTKKELKKLIVALDEIFATNQEKRDQHEAEPLKYMESEEALAAHLHEIQGLTAYPDRILDAVSEGLVESVLSIVMHPNIDISQLCVTLLYELVDKDLAESHPETVKFVMSRFIDNSIWTLLQKVIVTARAEKAKRGAQVEGLNRTEEDLIEQKCFNLLQSMLEISAEALAPKLMHADAFIEFLMASLEDSQEHSLMSYSQVLVSDILAQVIQNCGTDFRSKFAITFHGIVKLLTLIDSLLEHEKIVDTNLEVAQNIMDSLATLLVFDEIKENAAIFQEANGFQMMLHMIVNKPELRKEALKVVSYALLKCTQKQAIQFIDATKGLSVLFGLWALQPAVQPGVQLPKGQAELHRNFLYIYWNLLSALNARNAPKEDSVLRQLCLERLCFKFVENRLAKLALLVNLHMALYSRVADFDLSQELSADEMAKLEEHFDLEVLLLVDCIIATLVQTRALDKLLGPEASTVLKTSAVALSGVDEAQFCSGMAPLLRLQAIRCNGYDQEQCDAVMVLCKALAGNNETD